MKIFASFASFASIAACAVLLVSCDSPSDAPSFPTGANYYFFQQNTALEYTYSEDNIATTDVSTYAVKQNNTYGSFLSLVKKNANSSDTLLLFRNEKALDGSVV